MSKYIPTYKEFEKEFIRDMGSEDLCEYHHLDEYMKLFKYTSWLESKYSKRVDMTKREGYRF